MSNFKVTVSCGGHFERTYELEKPSEWLAKHWANIMYQEHLKSLFEIKVEEVEDD